MKNIKIEATEHSPEVDFNFKTNVFSLSGESHFKEVPDFFGPPINQLKEHLSSHNGVNITFNFELIYFNDSSAKILMELFEMLDEAAKKGSRVVINWVYDEDDGNTKEIGEELGEDLEHATFHLRSI
ncbi:MAG: DUF1987 domain-containing protein [Alphaproteobacteria bacterium]|nr:DUF1987 domain-containing protein [Rhodospirillales bacterium]MCW9044973.1 DUF1987 domain-containing protein [Alphaproteobacteria bacterium]